MNWVVAKIKWIMLVAGALTCTMLYAAVMPDAAVDFLFDRTLDGALGQVLVPSWAALVGLSGALLIYGAFRPQTRTLVMTAAGSCKLIFLGMMLGHGRQFLDEKVSLVLALDAVMVALFVTFLIGVRRARVLARVSQPAMTTPPRVEPSMQPTVTVAPRAGPSATRTTAALPTAKRPNPTTR
jgi:hypothetical protein